MALGTKDDFNKLRFTKAEEDILDFYDLESAIMPGWKLYTENNFNGEALKMTIKNKWKPTREVVIKDRDKNLFAFQLFRHVNKDEGLNEGPWAFDGYVLLLKEMSRDEQPPGIVFDRVRSWVKAYDLPVKEKKHMPLLNTWLLIKFGDHLKFRVDLDITGQLMCGMRVNIAGKPKWIKLKYVRLPNFCCGCGLLGHVYRGCISYNNNLSKSKLQYGPGLRVSPIKKRMRGMEDEWNEEIKKLLELRGWRIQTGLKFR
ncbi:hypothetical protein Cgig2_027495 [Carnegiea gigantea]|uniref:DUF4283 domain-containing protein n=1 Tax=Carnegiea gigantea TaxID=171969 RepID=A0A9Q1QL09_9CARY|nr:hypothetical protein Cgig2_027495 [Carnegiea gigantea]